MIFVFGAKVVVIPDWMLGVSIHSDWPPFTLKTPLPKGEREDSATGSPKLPENSHAPIDDEAAPLSAQCTVSLVHRAVHIRIDREGFHPVTGGRHKQGTKIIP